MLRRLSVMNKILTFFSLFGSLSTLLCCALPVTLVSLGLGATFASLTSTLPQIIWLTEYKDLLFIGTGSALATSYFIMKNSENKACPIDPRQRELCQSSKTISQKVYWTSLIMFCLGFGFSYILPLIYF